MAAKHREQYDRMMRWYARMKATDSGREHAVASDNYVDEIYAFFLNCYHLKDWIKKRSICRQRHAEASRGVHQWQSSAPAVRRFVQFAQASHADEAAQQSESRFRQEGLLA